MPTMMSQVAVSMMMMGSMAFALAIAMTMHITTACLEDERSFLLDFKAGLADPSARLSSWRGYNCCQWHGILCDSHSRHVIHLDLKNGHHDLYDEERGSKSLSGKIHPSLFNLQHLQLLDLSYNNFDGSAIPPQLAKLKRLTFLSLSSARFGGEIPVELGNISTLRHLDLSVGGYDDSPYDVSPNAVLKSSSFAGWVRNLRSLEYLAMEMVNLTMASERWGDALTSLPSLRQVYLSHCGLSGSIPSLLNLTHLSHLDLSGNSFPFPIPEWFQNVSTLVSVDLEYCDLRGSIPVNFLYHSSLSYICLSSNEELRGNLSFIVNHSSSLTVLTLNGIGIGGVIPRSISNFSKLEELHLSWNNLTGEIPPFGSPLGGPSPLSKIDLSDNNLKGSIPPSVGNLSSLKYLDLENNQLNGKIPDSISKLVGLQYLLLRSNSLTGNVTLSLFENHTDLQTLELSGNQLTVNVSSNWIPQFAHMRFIGLSSCNIEGYLPAFLSTQYFLEYLDLSDNNIGGNIPTWLWDNLNPLFLNLSNNKLEGTVSVPTPRTYRVLDLHANDLQGSLPVFDGGGLLDLSQNGFNDSIPAIVWRFNYLLLSENRLSGRIPDSLCSESSYLSFLDLSKNRLTGMISPDLGNCSWLEVLNLAENNLQGEVPKELASLTFLSILNLKGNRLKGVVPSNIANWTELRVLDLGYNNFEGCIPVGIGELTELHILSLASNNFQGNIPPQLTSLPNLGILDLSHNQLSGLIPQDLPNLLAMVNQSQSNEIQPSFWEHGTGPYEGSVILFQDEVKLWIKGQVTPLKKILKAFKVIDLSSNELSGNIPSEVGFLKGLISLNISRNHITGSIPKSLGDMAQLEALDLSGNKLSGMIPQELVNLTFLEVLNLSDNNLSGLIPQGKQFNTFEASAFAGNPNLHGPPLDNTTALKGGRSPTGGIQQERNNKKADEDEMDRWWAVAVGLSFGLGFGLVIGVLCFHVKWRNKYFAVMDGVVAWLFER
uniref:TSA: Wollemia nobilis Ref_Wollemi_Transcript_14684_3494 transcribed RNA sequence n=1 Tax=Wollemia nobilis TaxID=56998 RepID=A0A0C9S3T0_9CONI